MDYKTIVSSSRMGVHEKNKSKGNIDTFTFSLWLRGEDFDLVRVGQFFVAGPTSKLRANRWGFKGCCNWARSTHPDNCNRTMTWSCWRSAAQEGSRHQCDFPFLGENVSVWNTWVDFRTLGNRGLSKCTSLRIKLTTTEITSNLQIPYGKTHILLLALSISADLISEKWASVVYLREALCPEDGHLSVSTSLKMGALPLIASLFVSWAISLARINSIWNLKPKQSQESELINICTWPFVFRTISEEFSVKWQEMRRVLSVVLCIGSASDTSWMSVWWHCWKWNWKIWVKRDDAQA